MKKVLVISANIGNRCTNSVYKQQGADVTFISLDDRNFASREKAMYPRMVGKIPKMLAWELYPGYDVYIWMDSYFKMSSPTCVKWFLDQLGDKDALFFKHPSRSTIQEEARFLLNETKKGNKYIIDRCKGEDIEKQMKFYTSNPLFKDNLLIAAGAFAYTSSLVANKQYNLMKEWYYEVCRWNIRDQISLPYLLNTMNINFTLIEENLLNIKYLK